jgi:hypothetical protein
MDGMTGEQFRLLMALDCVLPSRSARYISGPITSGRRFLDWAQRLTAEEVDLRREEFEKLVKVPNEDAIITVADRVRESGGRPVIQPASLRVPEWSQPTYHAFWSSVLDRYVCELLLLDDWQYSVGCVVEFCVAARKQILIFDERGAPLTVEDGKEMIALAVARLKERGGTFDRGVAGKLTDALEQTK